MTKGSPRLTVRMPAPVIKALKQLAEARNITPSDILRELTIKELDRAGYSTAHEKGEDTVA